MKILGIETSCDDTGIAVLEATEGSPPPFNKKVGDKNPQFKILSNIVASQIEVHQEYGGVFPALAKREHIKNLPITLKKALEKAKIEKTDAIAITHGPGLAPCLWAGVNFAKDLAREWNIPLIPVNHMEGHLLVGLLQEQNADQFSIPKNDIFPSMALVVSGGHTQLVLVSDIGKYKIIGETRDDAAGECFDKTARILGLPYPGGPEIAKQAAEWREGILTSEKQEDNVSKAAKSEGILSSGKQEDKNSRVARAGDLARSAASGKSPSGQTARPAGGGTSRYSENLSSSKFNIALPRPMMHTKDYDFSFSGLKTAVLYDYKARSEQERTSKEYVQEMAKEIQQAIIDVLIYKTTKAVQEFGAKSISLGGGVSANDELRCQLSKKAQELNIELLAPPKNLSTDNGLMIALAGYFQFQKGNILKEKDELEARTNLRLS